MSGSMWSRFLLLTVTLAALAAAAVILPLPASAADEEECYRCHGLAGFTALRDGKPKSLSLAPEDFETSVHSLLNCRECHSDIAAIPHPEAEESPSCGQTCHQRNAAGDLYSHESLYWEYTTSVHGETTSRKITCMTCHPADSFSELSRRDLLLESRQCASCHRESGHVADYFRGFHYRSLSKGNRRAPSCPDCHTSHRILPVADDESPVSGERLVRTCGRGAVEGSQAGRCHGDVSDRAVRGAKMVPLPLPSEKPGPAGWAFSVIYWGMLGGLIARAAAGAVRRR